MPTKGVHSISAVGVNFGAKGALKEMRFDLTYCDGEDNMKVASTTEEFSRMLMNTIAKSGELRKLAAELVSKIDELANKEMFGADPTREEQL
jgi:hypothetical protein